MNPRPPKAILLATLFFPVLLFPRLGAAAELPPAWNELAAVSFTARQDAQQNLVTWATKHRETARLLLCRQYFQNPDPEIRRRLHDILRKTFGASQQAYLGAKITMADLSPKLAPRQRGIKVFSVSRNSSAARAGISPQDIITAIGDYQVKDDDEISDVIAVIKKLQAGKNVIFAIIRHKKPLKIRVPLLPEPGAEELSTPEKEALFQDWLSSQKKETIPLVGPPLLE